MYHRLFSNSLMYWYILLQIVIKETSFNSNETIFGTNESYIYTASKYIIILTWHVKLFSYKPKMGIPPSFWQQSYVLTYFTSYSHQKVSFNSNEMIFGTDESYIYAASKFIIILTSHISKIFSYTSNMDVSSSFWPQS